MNNPPPYDDSVKDEVKQTQVQVPVQASVLAPVQASVNKVDLTRFQQFVKQNELNDQVALQLESVLSNCDVVLLCDDSDSMANPIAEEGTDPFAIKRSTRWLELKKLASAIIQLVTAINQDGIDIYFLNRPKLTGVNNTAGLQTIFNIPPQGGTGLTSTLQQIYTDKYHGNKQLLIVVITDGEPTGTNNPRIDLYNKLVEITSNGRVHVSFAECTDNAEDMEYLDQWDGIIKNFDNTEDYREELNRVKAVQGNQFKFDYTDYVVKILLATFVRWYFNLDQVKVSDMRNNYTNFNNTQYQTAYQFPKTAYQQTQYQTQNIQPQNVQPVYQYVQQPQQQGSACCIIL
jgi:hypothetical protein